MPREENLRVNLVADNKKLKQGLDEGKQQMQSFGQSITKVAGMLGAAFSVTALIRFGSESAKLADAQLVAEQKLLVALNGREDAQRRLIAQAKQLQKVTRFGDEATIEAQGLLAILGLTEDQIRTLTPLILDMATGLGVDLRTASTLVGKSITTTTDALSRYFGTGLAGVIGQSERAAVLAQSLTDKFGGQAEAMSELALGPAIKLKNAFGDLREVMGGMLVERFTEDIKDLTKTVDALNVIISHQGGFLGSLRELNQELEDSLIFQIATKSSMLHVPQEFFSNLQILIQRLGASIEELPDEIFPAGEKAGIKAKPLGPTPSLVPPSQLITSWDLLDESVKSINKDLEKLPELMIDTSESFMRVETSAGDLKTEIKDMSSFMQEALDNIADNALSSTMIIENSFAMLASGMGEIFGNIATMTGNLSDQIRALMGDIVKQIGQTFIKIGTGYLLIPAMRSRGVQLIASGIAMTAFGQAASNSIHQATSMSTNADVSNSDRRGEMLVLRGTDFYRAGKRSEELLMTIT